MASYLPPTEYFSNITYNPSFYSSGNSVSLSYANSQFLPKVGTAVSAASSTTFLNAVTINGPFTATGVLNFQNNSISDASLSPNVAFVNKNNSFAGTNTFSNLAVSGSITLPSHSISDSALQSDVILQNSSPTFGNLTVTGNLALPSHSISDSALQSDVILQNTNATIANLSVTGSLSLLYHSIQDPWLSSNVILQNSSPTFGNLTVTGNLTLPAHSISDSALQSDVVIVGSSPSFVSSTFSSGISFYDGVPANTTTTFNEYLRGKKYFNDPYSGSQYGYLTSDSWTGSGLAGEFFFNNGKFNNLVINGSLSFPAHSISATSLPANVTYLDTAQTFTALQTFSSGVSLPSASLPLSSINASVAVLNSSQTFTSLQTFSSGLSVSGAVTLPSASIPITAINASVAVLNSSQTFTSLQTFSSGISVSGAVTLPSASLPVNVINANVSLYDTAQTWTAAQAFGNISANIITANNISISNSISYSTFTANNVVVNTSITLPSHSVADSALSTNIPLLNNANNNFAGNITARTFNLGYTSTLGPLSSNSLGYSLTFYPSSNISQTTATRCNFVTFSLPVGVWLINVYLDYYVSSSGIYLNDNVLGISAYSSSYTFGVNVTETKYIQMSGTQTAQSAYAYTQPLMQFSQVLYNASSTTYYAFCIPYFTGTPLEATSGSCVNCTRLA